MPDPKGIVRVVIADDQALVRTGLRLILEAEPDIEVVGEAEDGAEAVELVARLKPRVALLDIQMPVLDGLEAAKQILGVAQQETVRVLMLTTFDHREYVYEALRLGASGFLLKDTPAEHLAAGVRSVARGEALLAPTITRQLIEAFISQPSPGEHPTSVILDSLTVRERQIFTLLSRGLSNQEIARDLFLGETTVKTHVTRILTKLNLRDRIQAVILAYEVGVARPRA
ncbi:response regulator [Homoserinimonas sp. A520]